MAKVRIENIQKTFGKTTAVKSVSLDIPDGKFVVLVGPSGCGKTTLLRLLAGLEESTGGSLFIGDKDVTRVHPRERDIAMVFHSYALYPHMNVRRNMSFALELMKKPREEIDKRIANASGILGLEGLLDRHPRQLSGGQRQRVALGRAIVREPEVFLFDEPLSNLDAKLRTSMRSELIKLHKRLGTTIVYVTHDQVEAMTMGQLVVVMKDGSVQQVGEPLEIYRNPKNVFVAEFIGSPSMNFVPARIDLSGTKEVAEADIGTIPLTGAIMAQARSRGASEVLLGMRPEHILPLPPDGAGNGLRFDGTVEVVEPLGAETILELSCAGSLLRSRLPGDKGPSVGDRVSLHVDHGNILVFEKETGARLGL